MWTTPQIKKKIKKYLMVGSYHKSYLHVFHVTENVPTFSGEFVGRLKVHLSKQKNSLSPTVYFEFKPGWQSLISN